MCKCVFMAGLTAMCLCIDLSSPAQLVAVPLTAASFNADVIADGSEANPQTGTTVPFDGAVANNVFYSSAYQTAHFLTVTSGGLPTSKTLTSGSNSWQLQSYTANNCLFFPAQTAVSTLSMTLNTPTAFTTIALIGASGNGPCNVTISLHFSDNSTTSYLTTNVPDWFGGTPTAVAGVGRVPRTTTISAQTGTPGNPCIYYFTITLTTTDKIKNLSRIDITDNNTANAATVGFFGVSGTTTVLPIDMNSLKGQYDAAKKNVQLEWTALQTTAGESFQVQRSADGTIFTPLGSIDPLVTMQPQPYSYTDAGVTANTTYYYRIMDAQPAGGPVYSNVITVNTGGGVTSVRAWYAGNVLEVAGLDGLCYAYQLLNSNGQLLQTGNTGSGDPFTVNIPGISAGIYFLRLRNEKESKTLRLLKR